MKCLSLLVLTGLGGVAIAQPGPPPPPPDTGGGTTTNTTTTTEPTPPPTPPHPTTPVVQPDTGDSDRPEGLSFALGVGYTLPTSLQTPNTTTARLRLGSGLTLEPAIIISNG